MTPEFRVHLQNVLDTFYKKSKEEYNSLKSKPRDHVFKSLDFVKERIKVNRKNYYVALYCAGEHEVHSLLNNMMDLKETLDLDQNQMDWTLELNDEVTVLCLKKKPVGTAQRAIANDPLRVKIDVTEAKRMILARMRNMLLTQNI